MVSEQLLERGYWTWWYMIRY